MEKINQDLFKEYFKSMREVYLTRDYTELSFRTPFETFIIGLNREFKLLHEQKREKKLGAPDFKAFRKAINVGYIETKNLGINLDETLKSDQIRKYTEGINNLILTNYSRFIILRKGEKIFDINIFDVPDLDRKNIKISEDTINRFQKLIENFFGYKTTTIKSAPELARELSKKAKLLKEIAKDQLEEDFKKIEDEESLSPVYGFYCGIKELIHDINLDDCADAYAQTITYGIFLAKTNYPEHLERVNLVSHIPESIALIRKIFMNIIFNKSSYLNIVWIIDDIIDILNASDIQKILSEISYEEKTKRKRVKDPFLFFYEDFLESYDPEKRKHFGEYYTPRPVVNFILNVTNQILKDDFDKHMGFAEDDVTVLDPGVGTGTFLWIAYLLTFKELKEKGLGGLINQKIKDHILQDFYGFEISITSYIIAHLKLSTLLERWRYHLKGNERIQVYLTNTLERTETHGLLPFMQELSLESIKAGKIKEKPILAIIGNPPYRGLSANKGEWINKLLKEGYKRADGSKDDGYYMVDGKPLGERKLWLQDDYVKFIRFAQWKLDKAGEGVLAFINNHGWIDNPTFRGMRESLLQSFDRIYILNLHGNTRKKEKCPDGSKDENVFDIQQGVSINIFVKNSKYKDKKVLYADQWGTRNIKYEWLDKFASDSKNWLKTIHWREVKTQSPNYYFIPRDYAMEEKYNSYFSISDIFLVNNVGIVTARDKLTIQFTPEKMWDIVTDFSKIDSEVARKKYDLRKDVRDWKVHLAQKDIIDSGLDRKKIVPITYRPFDNRFTYYTGKTRGFIGQPGNIMKYMISGDNIALISARSNKSKKMDHFFITKNIMETKCGESTTQSYIFPLYRYENGSKEVNINPEILSEIKSKYRVKVTPEEVFYYIYSVFFSNVYRTRYMEFLRTDFPRIQFVKGYKLFKKLSDYGKELSELHLMNTRLPTETKFDIQGMNIVNNVKYKDGKVYINKEQYFDGVPEEAWNFHIGGYNVLDKWLKSRKNRELNSKEIEHFLQIVETIKKTIELMRKIDEIEFLE